MTESVTPVIFSDLYRMKHIDYTSAIRTFLFACTLLFNQFSIQAQELPSRRSRAQLRYDKMEYAQAAILLEPLVDVRKPKTADMELLAKSQLQINRYDRALNWYTRVAQQPDAGRTARHEFARVLKLQGRHEEAKIQYRDILQYWGPDAAVSKAIAGVDSAMVWMKQPTGHQLVNLRALNSASSDFGLQANDYGFIFVSEEDLSQSRRAGMTDKPYLRLFSAQETSNGDWSAPHLMHGPFNRGDYHIGPVSVQPDGEALYVTRTYGGNASQRRRSAGNTWLTQHLELKIYDRADGAWLERDFPYNKVDSYSVGHAAFSRDGQLLYFVSDMPGGHGGADIWCCERRADGSWGLPYNAGAQINSPGDELFPYVYGNDSLFFASDGHVGMGGLDLFRAVGQRASFSKPVNLGFPLNSSADDFGFMLEADDATGSKGFLSSNRIGGMGSDDIYQFSYRKPQVHIWLDVSAQDKKSGAALPGTAVVLLDKQDRVHAQTTTDAQGRVKFTLEKNTAYVVKGEQKGYHLDTAPVAAVDPARDTTLYLHLMLQPISTVGERFVLEDIYYDFDKYAIRPDAALVLDQLVSTLRSNPSLSIELSSHTDSRGTAAYNALLSQRRAQAAVDYLVQSGIARGRMRAKGYGETKPVNHCVDGMACSEEAHQANRRTEIEVLTY
ncbi:hypothetical protein C4F40_01030 [Sphingobacterium sp. Ka21]|uniref:OmpA-like domain-containing protein n=2 Tax=Sphingobacterium pedocola TaxID=2082722 RepID=A0ABR9T1U3_9SPHI|nr:hypothetical protein [Sphingobacterium pedocola]